MKLVIEISDTPEEIKYKQYSNRARYPRIFSSFGERCEEFLIFVTHFLGMIMQLIYA